MESGEDFSLPAELEKPALGVPDENSVRDATERIEPFLKGQGYLPIGGSLRVLNASATEACVVLDLFFRLASQLQGDYSALERLREQGDKDRVALADARRENKAQGDINMRLIGQVEELESKRLAERHKAEENERESKQKLRSMTHRLNGYLPGARKCTIAGTGRGGGAGASAGPRPVAPTYDWFEDVPAEAAAASQAARSSLNDASGAGLSSAWDEVARLQRRVQELELISERQKQQIEKAEGARSEQQKRLSQLRRKCATLEIKSSKVDRVLRATAALLEPAVAEAQTAELRAKPAFTERELANSRAAGLWDTELGSNLCHDGAPKRTIRALPKVHQALEELDSLVAEELRPLRDQLRGAKMELEAVRAQRDLAVRSEEPSCAGGVASVAPQGPFSSGGQAIRLTSDALPSSPVVPLPASPPARFNGFGTRPSPLVDTPPMLMQRPPVQASCSRAHSSPMPSERRVASSSAGEGLNDPQQSRLLVELSAVGPVASGGTQTDAVIGMRSGPEGGGAFVWRGMSASVSHRQGDAYTSAGRRRWKVHNPQARQRFPSPIDILLKQACDPTAADATISLKAPISEAQASTFPPGSTP